MLDVPALEDNGRPLEQLLVFITQVVHASVLQTQNSPSVVL